MITSPNEIIVQSETLGTETAHIGFYANKPPVVLLKEAPEGEWPEACGIEGNPLPEDYLGQLLHPFAPDRSDSRT